ncbi:MAG TPA: hypothetical protein VLA43_09365, partial [Longimicrobiales bacterium]|nr:hypothetical protein [Longimicrobiales bacterium]
MKFRFVFRDEAGAEVKIPSLGVLTRHVEDGVIGPDTPLFDVLIGEWAPARTHPVFRLIREESGLPLEEDSAVAGTDGDAPVPDVMDVVLTPQEVDDDTVQAFLESRERERREEGLHASGDELEIPLVDSAQETVGPGAAADPASSYRAPHPPPGPRGAPGSTARPGPSSRSVPGPRPGRAPGPRRSRSAPGSRLPPRQAALVGVLLGVGLWGIVEAWTAPADTGGSTVEPLELAVPPRAPGPLAASMREVHSGAFQDMVDGMDALRSRMRVGDPPAVWMSGLYIADAQAYPEVESYWQRYRTFVDTLRASEEDLFRAGLEARLVAQGIQGEVLAVRVTRGMQDFRADSARRAERYGAMNGLAEAALSLHGFLVDRSGSIRYAPAGADPTGDPVLEAVPLDEATRRELWERVDRLLAAVD